MENEQRTESGLRMLAWLGKQVQDTGLDHDLILGRSSHGWHGGVYRTSKEFRCPTQGEFFLTPEGRVSRCYAEIPYGPPRTILERLWPQDEPQTASDTSDTPQVVTAAPEGLSCWHPEGLQYAELRDWYDGYEEGRCKALDKNV
jgi:hypothetical protein